MLREVVAALRGGYIPARWQDMKVVLIPKPGRDLTQTKNWRPLNLINCVGKLGEKVVADGIQEEGSLILHHQQYGLVCRRSAGDVLYKSVVEARQCLEGGGSVGSAFWDIKGSFQNVQGAAVLGRLAGCGPLRCWVSWLRRFMSPTEFEVAWDGKARGKGTATKGVPQGSPLSPVLFLVYMAPILKEMEHRVKEEVGRVAVRFPSYVDDLHCGLYDRRGAEDEVMKCERMQDLMSRVQRVVAEVAVKQQLPLAANKEELMVIKGGCGRKKTRSGLVEKVKWLGVILDDRLDCKEHWRYRIGKARSLLGALDGVGNSRWGMNPVSWRAAYTGMVHAVAKWGVEIEWRRQREWRHELVLLQNTAFRKTLGAVKGSSGRKGNAIVAAVEDVVTFPRSATERFLARTLCDPSRAGVGMVDENFTREGKLSVGGECWRGHVDVVDLGSCKTCTSAAWERATGNAGERRLLIYTDGSRDDGGRVGGGWHAQGNGLVVLPLETSLLCGMERWRGFARHSGWPRRVMSWCCLTRRQRSKL